ncbi:hypothetical protein N7540_000723 [Penicillium herquei]|nr:hypothetical protein N7540_000723 [Penicillium herquei]
MPKLQEKRPSRITAACSTCRSRKQKCSGEKGPAKGYVENLEHRLQVTEGVLLKLLTNVVSDAQLQTVFPELTGQKRQAGLAYAPLERLEKRGIEYWAQYPLDSAENIREWSEACTGHETRPPSSQPVHEPDISPIESQQLAGTKRKAEMDTENQILSQELGILPAGLKQLTNKKRYSSSVSTAPPAQREEPPRSSEMFHWGMRREKRSFDSTSSKIVEPVNHQELQALGSRDDAPSTSFKSQFLW